MKRKTGLPKRTGPKMAAKTFQRMIAGVNSIRTGEPANVDTPVMGTNNVRLRPGSLLVPRP